MRGAAVNGQRVPQDECSSDGGLHCAIDERVVELNQVHREVVIADPVPNSEEAGSWYYVVDCATCKAVIPFKHAPEGEPILRFPTMGVRCFQCRTVHTYAADLVSHRKAVAPPEICKGGPTVARDAVRDALQYRQEDHSVADSSGCAIVECKIEPDTFSLRRDNIAIDAVSGKRAVIFFLSSCFFAAAWIVQLALNILHPVSLAAFNKAHSYGPAVLLESAYCGAIFSGLTLFIFGMVSFLFRDIRPQTYRSWQRCFGAHHEQRFYAVLDDGRSTASVAFLARQARRTLSPWSPRRRRSSEESSEARSCG